MRSARWLLAALVSSCFAAAGADDLLLNHFPMPIRTVVYEMPGVPADKAGELVGQLRRALAEAEFIDGVAMQEAELRKKLRGPWVLLTLLTGQSRLLKMTAPPLLRLENETFRWGEITAPAREIRALFMGKNPFGEGACMVVALGLGQRLGISVRGEHSYVLYRGTEIVASGVYDRAFRPQDRDSVSLAEANADVEQFFSTLERVHPGVFATLGSAGYAKMRDATREAVAPMAGPQGRVQIGKLAWLLMYAGAALRDGHTGVTWRDLREQSMAVRGFPPFLLDALNGRFRIAAALDPALTGAELVGVNGTAVDDFFRPALDRCSGETALFRARLLARHQAFWWAASGLFGRPHASVSIRIRDAKGAVEERAMETVGYSEFRKLQAPAPPLRKSGVRLFDSGKVAHWVLPGFALGEAEKKSIEDVIREVRAAGATDLIIDLRGNGGGASGMGDYIFRRIWREPVEQVSELRIRVSPESVAAARKNAPAVPPDTWKLLEAYQGKLLSSKELPLARMIAELARKEPPPAAVYSGRLWLLVDNGTFSSANLFAVAFRDFGMGGIVGYETGEPPVHFGDCPGFDLKHSRIPYRVSTRQFFPPKPRAGDGERGVQPDIMLDQEALAPYKGEPDPELAFTLDLVRKRK